MSSNKRRDRTFRVRNLPSHVDRHGTIELLVRIENSLGPADNILVYSLAASLNPWERPPTKMATVVFKREPDLFNGSKTQWALPGQHVGLYREIIIDVHFLDFTVLNEPESHEFDCIAISGLASHPFGSWMERDESTNFMWLRDRLPKDMTFMRSVIYGYDTQLLNSESTQTVDDIATTFINQLRSFGSAALSAKPLILLAHSLGGIILKRAIVLLANSGERERTMLDSIKQITLFGVPHKGMQVSHLLPMVTGQPNQSLIEFLTSDSIGLKDLREQFDGIATLQNMQIISVFETKRSQIPRETEDGTWSRDGRFELLVDRASAVHDLSLPSYVLPVNEDHSNMAKFSDGDSPYHGLLNFFFDLKSRIDERETLPDASAAVATSALNPTRLLSLLPQDMLDADAMLKSLETPDEGRRLFEIPHPTAATFDWIYTDSRLGFESWTRGECSLFWVSGKPGSGKSTFMKYIYEDLRTHALLKRAKTERVRQICASFFFHDRGSHAQKSFEGLLRSILLQILTVEPALRKPILPLFRKTVKHQKFVWILNDLEQAFAILSDQKLMSLTIFLFLDALDEYDGSAEVITSFILSLTNKQTPSLLNKAIDPQSHGTRFQLCFSSRQWPIFNDAFVACAGVRIHEHTRGDIERYVLARLEGCRALNDLLYPATDFNRTIATKFVSDIVERAQGVFLWVALIMSELHIESTNGASLTETIAVLETFPGELENFYDRTLKRIPLQHRPDGYVMIETVLRSRKPPTLKYLAGALACAGEKTVEDCKKAIRILQSSFSEDDICRRVKGRCGGLLEVIELENRPSSVQFVHQTMKEFAERPDFRNRFLGRSRKYLTENGHTILSKLYFTLLLPDSPSSECILEQFEIEPNQLSHRSRNDTFWNMFYHFQVAELTTGKSQRRFIETMGRENFTASYSLWKSFKVHSSTSFAVSACLTLYLQEYLGKPNHFRPDYLLHCAVASIWQRWAYLDLYGFEDSCTKVIKLLLGDGADVNTRIRGETPTQMLLSGFDHVPVLEFTEHIFEIADLLVKNGQDPNSVTVTYSKDSLNGKRKIASTLLHISPFKFTQTLLEHKADVNALDSDLITPLDRRLILVAEEGEWSSSSYFSTYKSTMALLRSKAPVTKHGDRVWKKAAARFASDFGWNYTGKPRMLPITQGY